MESKRQEKAKMFKHSRISLCVYIFSFKYWTIADYFYDNLKFLNLNGILLTFYSGCTILNAKYLQTKST